MTLPAVARGQRQVTSEQALKQAKALARVEGDKLDSQ
jgi:hypothetical protein